MNRTAKIIKDGARKSEAKEANGDKIQSRLERLEQALRNAKGTVTHLEQLVAEEKEQAGN